MQVQTGGDTCCCVPSDRRATVENRTLAVAYLLEDMQLRLNNNTCSCIPSVGHAVGSLAEDMQLILTPRQPWQNTTLKVIGPFKDMQLQLTTNTCSCMPSEGHATDLPLPAHAASAKTN